MVLKFIMILGGNMNDVQREILLITQEECAEVTQAISKIFRFGLMSEHKGVTNLAHLEEEAGDLLCMLYLMQKHGLVDWVNVEKAKANKLEKLKTWSSIK